LFIEKDNSDFQNDDPDFLYFVSDLRVKSQQIHKLKDLGITTGGGFIHHDSSAKI
jgi:hypothetical protein